MMKNWDIKKLRDLADIRISNVDKKIYPSERPVKFCNYMDVYANDYITGSIQFMEGSANDAEVERFGLNIGDVIITKDSETPDDIGIPTVIYEQIDNLVCGYHLALIRPDNEKLDSIFLSKYLSTSRVANYFALHASGSTRFGLPIGAIESVEILTPPKEEQKQIAKVLSTIDRAIAQTEAIIAKQQRIKTGLMQDLLTRGIDENGNIRSEATHEFKDCAIGRIPIEWELSNLIAVLSLTPKNGIYKPANQIGQGVLLIGQTSFTEDRLLNYKLARRASVTISELQAYQLEEEDILISRVFATVEGVGLPAFVSNLPEESVYESNMLRLRIDNQIILPKLVFYWLNSEQVRKYIIASVNASNQTSINQKTLNALPIPVPPKNEQIKLLKILEKNISCLIEEKGLYHKRSILKAGLMQDLLTCKFRVTNRLKQKAATN